MKILNFKDIMLPRGCFRQQPSTLFILSSQMAWTQVSWLLSPYRTWACLRKPFWVLTGEGCCFIFPPLFSFLIRVQMLRWERNSGKLAKSWPHRWYSFLRGSAVCQWEKRHCLESGSHGQLWLRGRWGGGAVRSGRPSWLSSVQGVTWILTGASGYPPSSPFVMVV